MEISPDSLPWHSDDEEAWQKFLSSQPGQRLIPKLLESVPELLSGGGINEVLIRSGELRGWKAAVSTLILLSHAAPLPVKPEEKNYPSLHDDAAWADGEKTDKPDQQPQ